MKDYIAENLDTFLIQVQNAITFKMLHKVITFYIER